MARTVAVRGKYKAVKDHCARTDGLSSWDDRTYNDGPDKPEMQARSASEAYRASKRSCASVPA